MGGEDKTANVFPKRAELALRRLPMPATNNWLLAAEKQGKAKQRSVQGGLFGFEEKKFH